MTWQSLEELISTWRPRYLRASRKEKTLILDEFVALTGYHRKAAIRVLRKGRKPQRWDRRKLRGRSLYLDIHFGSNDQWQATTPCFNPLP